MFNNTISTKQIDLIVPWVKYDLRIWADDANQNLSVIICSAEIVWLNITTNKPLNILCLYYIKISVRTNILPFIC
jgi:hypothetical protein